MNEKQTITNNGTERFILVPEKFLKDMEETKTLINKLNNSEPKEELLGDYVTEKQAKVLLGGKSTTWLFYARRGEKKVNVEMKKLPYMLKSAKVGNKHFYRKADILKILDDAMLKKEAYHE